jgi:hypothetical protein
MYYEQQVVIARQRHIKHFSAVIDTDVTIEELLPQQFERL